MAGRASNNIPPSLLKVWQEQSAPTMSSEKFTGNAIVAHSPLPQKGWKMEEVTTGEMADDELVVEMVATGICHTDIMVSSP